MQFETSENKEVYKLQECSRQALSYEKQHRTKHVKRLVSELKFIQLSYPELKDEKGRKMFAHGEKNNQIYNLMWMGLKIAPQGRHNKTQSQ